MGLRGCECEKGSPGSSRWLEWGQGRLLGQLVRACGRGRRTKTAVCELNPQPGKQGKT